MSLARKSIAGSLAIQKACSAHVHGCHDAHVNCINVHHASHVAMGWGVSTAARHKHLSQARYFSLSAQSLARSLVRRVQSLPAKEKASSPVSRSRVRTRSWERRLQRQRLFDFRLQNTLGARHEQSRADSTGSVRYLYQRQTPSEYLFEALRTLNQHQEYYMAKPEHKKVDLSWIHPKHLREEKAIYWAKGNKSKRLLSNIPPLKLVTRPPRRSLMTILAEYIRDVEPYLQRRVLDKPPKAVGPDVMQSFHDALLNTFNKHSLRYLSERGYTVTDVVTWAWILTGRTSLQSAKRYAAAEEHARQTDTSSSRFVARPLPPSLLLFLLRRTDIDAKALRLYILQAANLLSSSSRPPTSASKKQGARHDWDPYNGPDTTMVLIIRLIRAARIVWPAALVSVSNLVTSVYGFDAIMKHYDGNVDLDLRRALVERYNKILALLSLACNISPFNSSGIQQSAQFHLLREMTKFTPPLVVNRMGFQAITRVQVTHARTESENDWARSQRKSWPPWKETRLGIDPEKGEGSESRAVRAISYMVSAGYALSVFDQASMINGGWDTDRTPTVKTRTTIRRTSTYELRYEERNPRIWAARIRATRTLKEAWACFLAYEDNGGKPHNDVYFAIAEKIVYYRKIIDEPKRLDTLVLPGDMREPYPEPTSPMDVTYVRKEPPTLEELLLHKTFAHNLALSGRFLCLVLENSRSLEVGMHVLKNSQIGEAAKRALLLTTPPRSLKQQVKAIPNHIFASFIRFLSNFADVRESTTTYVDTRVKQAFLMAFQSEKVNSQLTLFPSLVGKGRPVRRIENLIDLADPSMAFAHALQLVRIRAPKYPPVWHHVLSALATEKFDPDMHRAPLSMQRVCNFWDLTECLHFLHTHNSPIDNKTLEIVCNAMIKLLVIARLNMAGVERGLRMQQYARMVRPGPYNLHYKSATHMLEVALQTVKACFDELMLPSTRAFTTTSSFPTRSEQTTNIDISSTLPLMIQIPPPYMIHILVRVLGLAEDSQGLLILASWLQKHEPEVSSAVEERAGGRRQMRYAVCAMRLFLEDEWNDWDPVLASRLTEDSDERREMKEKAREEVRSIVEDTPLLTPWPGRDEVEAYLMKRPFENSEWES